MLWGNTQHKCCEEGTTQRNQPRHTQGKISKRRRKISKRRHTVHKNNIKFTKKLLVNFMGLTRTHNNNDISFWEFYPREGRYSVYTYMYIYTIKVYISDIVDISLYNSIYLMYTSLLFITYIVMYMAPRWHQKTIAPKALKNNKKRIFKKIPKVNLSF